MNDMFTFERPDWELLVDSLEPGSTLSALRLLEVLEPEDDTAVQEALSELVNKRVKLDFSRVPKDYGSGKLEAYLRREEALAQAGSLLTGLEPSDPVRLYLEELARVPAQGDPAVLVEQLMAGNEPAREKLANLYMHRVVEIAKEYTGRGVLLLDLLQEGNVGLWQGILTFSGGDFEAFIEWKIRQNISWLVLTQARENGVLRSMQRNMEAYRQADKRLLTQLGRNATVEELALELGITPEQADVIRDMILNASAMEKVRQTPEAQSAEDEQAVEDTAYFQSRQRVNEMLSVLSQQESRILALRFGLEGGNPLTAEQTAARLGLTAEQVVAAETEALQKLRNE